MRRSEERLSFLAYHDPLTRLPNRTAFMERFAPFRQRALAEGWGMAVLTLGADRFGIINATMGHDGGDRVLLSLAEHLLALVGNGGVVARSSGDRFVVLLTDLASRGELEEAVDHLHRQAPIGAMVGDSEVDLTLSIGVAIFPEDGDNAEALIRNSDAALQQAKTRGPDSLQYYTGEMARNSARAVTLQAKLRHAIENVELTPYFQPKVDISNGAIVGMEALVRWISPDLGMVSPAEFIPIAEESGMIDSIGELMLRQCTWQIKQWQGQGIATVPVAVNVSGRQFQSPRRLLNTVQRVLADSGLDPRYLEIELTESSAMRDPENSIATVRQLRDIGISCSIDDFGTGYSSLGVLKRFPIDGLKIDRSFVQDISNDLSEATIVEAIIAMAKALGLKTIAEGVESCDQIVLLRTLGCDQIQGYYFSKPMNAKDTEVFLSSTNNYEIHTKSR